MSILLTAANPVQQMLTLFPVTAYLPVIIAVHILAKGGFAARSSRMVLWAGCTVYPESVPYTHAADLENGQRNACYRYVAGGSGCTGISRAFGVCGSAVLPETVSDVPVQKQICMAARPCHFNFSADLLF